MTVAAALLHPWRRCHGFEVVESLHRHSERLADEYHDSVAGLGGGHAGAGVTATSVANHISFEHCDARDRAASWCQEHRPTLVFAHATCFGDQLMAEMASALVPITVGLL